LPSEFKAYTFLLLTFEHVAVIMTSKHLSM
jgi:hypothetical protein